METGDHVDDPNFPCALNMSIPFPSHRLARTALQALQVDPELSPLVRRHLAVARASTGQGEDQVEVEGEQEQKILEVRYRATTNRMLRVAVNSFMDGLRLVIEVMEHLDVHALEGQGKKDEVEGNRADER